MVHNKGVAPIIEREGVEYLHLNLPQRDEKSFVIGGMKVNEGIRRRKKGQHLFISGDDSEYPKNYVETILHEMEKDPKIGIISGDKLERGIWEISSAPEGSGRMYHEKIADLLPFPQSIVAESWILLEVLRMGMKNKVVHSIAFNHMRPCQFTTVRTWGHAAYMLGYPVWYTLLRTLLIILRERKLRFSILFGHIEAMLLRFPQVSKDLRMYVAQTERDKIASVFSRRFAK